ncbi:MAG TPA: ATP-binding protein [Methanocella sp.]|nr:ATP-binding protein [Methanocella sp.]
MWAQRSGGVESRIYDAIETMPEPVLFFEDSSKIKYANKAGKALLNFNGSPGYFDQVFGGADEQTPSGYATPYQAKSILKRQSDGEEVYFNVITTDGGTLCIGGSIPCDNTEVHQRNNELAALYYISAAANSTLDLKQVLSRSITKTCEVTGIDNGCIFLIKQGRLALSAHCGLTDECSTMICPLEVRECVEGQAILNRAPEVIYDLSKYRHMNADILLRSGIQSLVSVPIIFQDHVIGVMDLATKRKRHFSDQEVKLYMSIANTMGVAINNASYANQIGDQKHEYELLVDDLRHSNEQLRLIYEVQSKITRTIDMDETLNLIIKYVLALTGLENCIIFLAEGSHKIYQVKATEQIEKQFGRLQFNMDELAASRNALETHHPIIIEDSSTFNNVSPKAMSVLGARTGIILPMIARDKALGVIWLYNTHGPRKYSEEDLTKASSLSDQAAIAIDKALLFQELSRANQELENSYVRLKSIDRMKMEFFTLISHELRTPLTTIKGYSELMKDGVLGPVNNEQRDRLSRIDNSVDQLTRIVEGLSNLSGVASREYIARKIPVSLNELVDSVVDGILFLAERKNISIEVNLPPNLPVVYIDRDQIQQVLLNILNNAIKYTHEKGKIIISAVDEADHVVVMVHDTGIGIPKEDLENIFSGFYHSGYKLSYEYKGAGLGLAISRRIVEGHGGRIWAESEPGKGSKFYFTIPKHQP